MNRLRALEIADTVTGIGVIEARPGLRLAGPTGMVVAAPGGYRHFGVG